MGAGLRVGIGPLFVTSNFLLLVVRPGAPSSVLVTTSKALVTRSDALVTSNFLLLVRPGATSSVLAPFVAMPLVTFVANIAPLLQTWESDKALSW